MSSNTKIEWTDATWNPVTGCTRVSEGCRNCYMARTVPRQGQDPWTSRPTQWPPSNDTFSDGTFQKSFLKDKKGGNWDEWPDDLRVREFPRCPRCGSEEMNRVHHAATFALPECWVMECGECGYEGEPS